MPIINIFARKRARSPSKTSITDTSREQHSEGIRLDGTASLPSAGSAGSNDPSQDRVRHGVKKAMSSIVAISRLRRSFTQANTSSTVVEGTPPTYRRLFSESDHLAKRIKSDSYLMNLATALSVKKLYRDDTVIHRPLKHDRRCNRPAGCDVAPLDWWQAASTVITSDSTALLGDGDATASCSISAPHLSIRTVEAAATAKIYLETYYNQLLNVIQPRDVRRYGLEAMMYDARLPGDVCEQARDILLQHETNHLRNRRRNVAMPTNYEFIKVLGKGSFGVVRLVRERINYNDLTGCHQGSSIGNSSMCSRLVQDSLKRTSRVFAMKVIRKSEMIRNCQEGHLRAERDFLVSAEGSTWIVPLHAASQDQKFLYLVMEYCIGGDFLGLMFRRDILSEEIAKWYVAEMILCVEEAHRLRWIHRDVKPDNFLIGADGHLKISDFGLAFDGQWQHDQGYFNEQRHSLLDRLGIRIEGDKVDQREHQTVEHSRHLAGVLPKSTKRKEPLSQDESTSTELLLDWRNRVQRRRLAESAVGTSQYMAPEVIQGDAYDGRCD